MRKCKLTTLLCFCLLWNAALAFGSPLPLPDNEVTVIIAANAGKIPTNFSDFLDLLGGTIGFLINIPLGRSLQKEKADLAHPRRLSIAGNTFVGFAENANQIELISWNPRAGQYDFMIVTDFAQGKTPQLSVAPRNLCLSCHQAGGPIFPRIPWSETDNPQGNDLVFQAMQAINPKVEKGASPFGFDDAVRDAADRIRLRKICDSYCQDDACRLRLLAVALRFTVEQNAILAGASETPFVTDEEEASRRLNSVEAQAFLADQQAIFQNGFSTPSSVIPDRDPLANLSTVILGSDPLRFNTVDFAESKQPFEYREDAASFNDFKPTTGIKTISGIIAEADPATPRPFVTNFIEGMNVLDKTQKFFGALTGACFGLDLTQENSQLFDVPLLHKLQHSNLSDFLAASPNHDLLLKQWPPQKDLILATLRGEKFNPPPSSSPNSPNNGNPALGQINNSQTFLFTKYCSECHGGAAANSSISTLPLEDLSLLKRYRDGKILQYLKTKKMPSRDAAAQPSDEERATMIQMLEDVK